MTHNATLDDIMFHNGQAFLRGELLEGYSHREPNGRSTPERTASVQPALRSSGRGRLQTAAPRLKMPR